MKELNKYLTFLLILISSYSFATHNRAGEITYEQIGPLTIRMTLTTYTKTSSASADRDSVEIHWGDGSKQFVGRSNGNGVALPNDVKVNKYVAEHTYPGRATYTISFADPNRVGNILNINYPNSIDVPFSLNTTFTLLDFQFQGQNSSAQLLQPPLDFACVGKRFIHNPNAYDVDGDSLAYELAIPFAEFDILVPGYQFPDRILPGPNNSISLNPVTGDFIWNAPPQQGEYNIAIKIKEYRNGVLINSIIRDMQILVRACENDPPDIDVIEEICIVAGDTLDLDILVSDSDIRQNVSLSASGGPFELQNGKAILENGGVFLPTPFTGRLIWATNCDHISNQYYQIVFRAVDNFFGDTTGLANLKTLRIKVVGPSPENLNATSISGGTRLTWDLPYTCEDINDGEFLGFAVYRKQNPLPIYPDTCNPGLENSIYERIVILTSQNDGLDYFYEDLNIEGDITYCYRVEALFAKLTSTGNPFNVVASLPSNETCLQLKRDRPILTKVSVLETEPANGEIHVRWQKPLPEDVDTVAFPGPYRFELHRRSGLLPFTLITDATVTANTISEIIDTNYFDTNLNTLSNQFVYKLLFYHRGNQLFGESEPATSIFLSTTPSDNQVILNWTSTTPWTNLNYEVYKETTPGNFSLIAVTRNTNYRDIGLINGENYCYVIKGIGSFGLNGIEEPIENFSQEACGMPQDNVPPCSPTISVTNVCDDPRNLITQNFSNTITWNDPNIGCPLYEQVKGYNIYYKSALDAEYIFIDFKSEGGLRQYIHNVEEFGLAGCYYITALDELDNESEPSNIVCVENCPLYELPNTFTPNGDNANDVFKPIRNFFITKIELKVFNEWGNLVFETEDPLVNWPGTTSNGNEVQQGTYYYSCVLYNLDSEGNEVRQSKLLKGFIQILK